MSGGSLPSPIVVDGLVSEEKVSDLLARQTEYAELDFKSGCDLSATRDVVELAKDVGAMRVRGGYILIGVNDDASVSGALDETDVARFDEARLVPKLSRFFDEPVTIHTNVIEVHEHRVAVLCVEASPNGCSFFKIDGTFETEEERHVAFRKGDVYWRNGTRSERMGQAGLEEVLRRRVQVEKSVWMSEQDELRRRDRESLNEAYRTQGLGERPLGEVTLDLSYSELQLAALELLRRGDDIAFAHIWIDGRARARALISADDIEGGLGGLLDKATCLAATFLTYGQTEAFRSVVRFFVDVYGIPLGVGAARSFGIRSRIGDDEIGPRVWLLVLERVTALGGLAVRRQDWDAVRELTLQLPDALVEDGYETNWRRHALTMASRAQQFERRGDGENISLLSLAATIVAAENCLRPDGIAPDDDRVLTSLAQFDAVSCVVAMADVLSVDGKVFYPNFARFRQHRVEPIFDRLVTDCELRRTVLPGLPDNVLAAILKELGRMAGAEGARFGGFDSWRGTPVAAFIAEHLPEQASGT